ncbi:MAG: rRNA pseudouridine2604 synthase [Patescibacteria group bacterium]|jgi:23S rRNA pseudouridine2604 synthase|nr:rRNA pseudouridine2604 synthase [Patescibacteria group bacterium]
MDKIRINKYLADKGIATRRKADELVSQGKILINGKVAKLGDQVWEDDKVEVKGMKEEKLVYYAYNKPVGVTTIGKQPGEEEIKDITQFPIKVFPVGRLDKDSSGLLIMTNDGRITKKLLDPKYDHEKEYIVEVNHPIEHTFMVRLRDGVKLGKEITKKAKVRKIDKYTLEIIITEGKNRQIRRMCASFNYDVRSLKRIRVMNIELGKLKSNYYREIKGKELEEFLKKVL